MIIFLLSFIVMAHDAAFEFENSIYMFHGGNQIRYQKGASKVFEGYPKAIDDEQWPGLEVFRTRIVAALNQTSTEVLFFLSDGRSLLYDVSQKQMKEPPKPLADTEWSTLAPFADTITAAYRWNEQHSFFFLSSGRVIRYDHEEKRVDADGIQPLSDTIWNGIKPEWGDVEQAFSWSDTSVFLFFSSGVYVKYLRDQQRVGDNYPKKIDERRWPGMGDWRISDSRLKLSPLRVGSIETEVQVAFSLPQHVVATEHSRKTAQSNRRYLTIASSLVASSEYPDKRSLFRLVPVDESPSHGFQPVVLRDSSGLFLTMRGSKVIKTRKEKDAEVFFLDTTWGEYVVLFHHKSHPKWRKKDRLPAHTSLKPITFVADGESVVAVSQEKISAGSLLRIWIVE